MKQLLFLLFFALFIQFVFSQNNCKYPKKLEVQFSIPSGIIQNAADARLKVSITNHGKKSVVVYDTLIDGALYGFDSNLWIELKFQESDSLWKEIRTYYGSTIPNLDTYQSQLTKSSIVKGETKMLFFNFFPNYVKYLKKGRYVAQLGLRKLPRKNFNDCGEYYYSNPIFFEVINEIR